MKRYVVTAVVLLVLAACKSAPTLDVTRRGSLDLGSCPFITYLRMMDESRVFVQATMGGGYSIVDFANPAAPAWLTENNATLPAAAAAFSGDIGYVAGYTAVRIVRFPRGSAHQVLDSFQFRAEVLTVSGTLLFAAGADSLCILDITNPAAPVVQSRVALSASGGKSGFSCVAADSDRLFVGRWVTNSTQVRLYLYNIGAPAAPALLDSVSLDGTAWGAPVGAGFRGDCVLFANTYGLFTAQLTDGRSRLQISDSTDILAQYHGSSTMGGDVHATVSSMEVAGDYAICACRCSVQVAVMDITNPRHPALVYSTAADNPAGGSVAGLAASDRFFYVAIESQVLTAYELPE